MKTRSKTIIPLFLVSVLFTSCRGHISSPTMHPTDVMETSMSFVKTEIVETLTAAPTSTAPPQPPTPVTPTLIPPTQTPFSLTPIDRHDPESIVRAYLDAWNRNDWPTRDALARQKMTYGKVEYVHILEIKNVSLSPTEPIYTVVLEIKPEGHEVTTIRQRYHLSWDAQGDTWYISNQGSY